MPQTDNQNFPYPAETDTSDVPRDIQSLAVAIDDAVTAGQVVTANAIPPILDFTSGTAALPDEPPFDGYLVRAKVDVGVNWLLGWSADDSMWNYLGGAGFSASITTSEQRTTNTYAALATPGPVLTLPVGLDGHYEIRLEALISGSTGDGAAYYSYKVNSGSASDGVGVQNNNQSAADVGLTRNVTLAGGDVVTAQYRGNNASASTFADRRMTLTPRYIQPA